ncbi:hypothetical protein AMATHDRAFT_71699 [Amanita thiersii Skay4041]|uniref:FAD-binding PCMH-type domain-containing protein n=1 Tax=Amanita thiersii Skay4041 TaxID=703135 RepID=A0A2A9N8L6_9AGAR|nr:hypothetical protein AMATHDRAFT_71699 [Amanita thiersii Skay4041]
MTCRYLYPLALLATTDITGNLFQACRAESNWDTLNQLVGGRLQRGVPFAQPCYTQGFNSSECQQIKSSYVDEITRSRNFGAYIQTQWETCQETGQQCLLDSTMPSNEAPIRQKCQQGSVSEHYIDVKTPDDVKQALKFSRKTGIPIIIKNTGHDYKGRSSAPGSLALWTHNLKNISYKPDFIPEGCKGTVGPQPAVTMGAGIQWMDAYAFADKNNITLVGGSDRSVGAAGGWLQGGGHGALTNTMGLGVDRVLEYKVVTPDGRYRTANACQNKDLFFALRGGGGGTFGVVLESTILAAPPVKLQTVIVSFPTKNATLTRELWTILVDNGIKWADEGWGGYGVANVAILLNPKMGKEEAQESMRPLIEFGERLKADTSQQGSKLVVTEFPTWKAFFDVFTGDFTSITGVNLALASRLVSRTNFATPGSRSELVTALQKAETATPGLIMLIAAPSTFPYVPGATSVTEKWRTSVYHVTVVAPWKWNATKKEIRARYTDASRSIDALRKITEDAAYVNEADVYEPNHEVAFWGSNYPELLRIKNKYDPDHLLDCWHCVGWNPKSSRFSCYL